MKIGVFADKGMGRWFAQLFDDMEEVTFYLSENNKHGLDVTQHKKHILTKKNNILKCLKKPIQCFGRFKENKFDNRLDFHYLELEEIIVDPAKSGVPQWALNRRRDYDTGDNMHLTMNELDFTLRTDGQRLAEIRSYRGLRRMWGLTVRGQKTKSTHRRSGAIGVAKKDVKK